MEEDVRQLCCWYESLRKQGQLLGLDTVVPESGIVSSFALQDDGDPETVDTTRENESFQQSVDRLIARFVKVQKNFYELEEVVPLVEDIDERTQKIRSIVNEFDILVITVKSLMDQQQYGCPDEYDDNDDGSADGKKPAARGSTNSSSRNGFHNGTSWQCDICDEFFYGNQETFVVHLDNCRRRHLGGRSTPSPTFETRRNNKNQRPENHNNERNIVETPPNNNQHSKRTSRRRSHTNIVANKRSGKRFRSESLPRGYRCAMRKELDGDQPRCPPGYNDGTVTVNDCVQAIRNPTTCIRRIRPPIALLLKHEVKMEQGPTNQHHAVARSNKYNFVLSESSLNESRRKPIWGLAWSSECHASASSTTRWTMEMRKKRSRDKIRYLATCGGRFVTLYAIPALDDDNSFTEQQGYGCMNIEQVFEDPDPDEDYYVCAFISPSHVGSTYPSLRSNKQAKTHEGRRSNARRSPSSTSSSPCASMVVCVGGQQGVIRVIDPITNQVFGSLRGHGDEIFDLKPSPIDEHLLLSASKDESCRLWNLRLGCTVAVFGGHVGHRDAINTISWHSSGTKFVSGGQDTTVKIWELSTKVQDAISLSHEIANEMEQQEEETRSDPVKKYAIDVVLEQFPIFSSGKLHVQRLNCVHFVGDLIVSKAALESFLKIWHPHLDNTLTSLGTRKVEPVPFEASLLRKFPMPHSDTWFRRFAVDDSLELLAAGNDSGKVFVWDMGYSTTRPMQRLQLKLGKKVLPSSVVNLSFSPDRSMLVATTETGALCRFDIQRLL